LLAYGCNQTIVVVDSKQLQVIQTLDKHKSPVVKVNMIAIFIQNYFNLIFILLIVGEMASSDSNRCWPP